MRNVFRFLFVTALVVFLSVTSTAQDTLYQVGENTGNSMVPNNDFTTTITNGAYTQNSNSVTVTSDDWVFEASTDETDSDILIGTSYDDHYMEFNYNNPNGTVDDYYILGESNSIDVTGYSNLTITIITDEPNPDLFYSSNGTNWNTLSYTENNDTITADITNFSNNQIYLQIDMSGSTSSSGSVTSTNGTFVLSSVIVTGENTNSIKDNELKNYQVFSFQDNIKVTTTDYQKYNLQVFSTNGQLLIDYLGNGTRTFDSNLSTGIYIVKIQTDEGTMSKKVAIQ